MKKAIILINAAILLFACGGNKEQSVEEIIASGNLEEIRAKRTEVEALKTTYAEQIEMLDGKISELDTNKKIPSITTFILQEDTFEHFLEFQGSVNTKNLLIIYPEYAGLLTAVYVREGDRVSKGQTLAKIDDGGLSQQLAQLEIQRDLAKTTYERQQRLYDQKIGSEIQLLQVKTSYEAQEKAINQLKKQLEKTVVKAPFSGIIDEVITEQGSLVNPGASPLMRILNLNEMYIETNVPESYISTIAKGKNVAVEFPVLGKTVHTKISQVSNYINQANRTFKIEVDLPNKDQSIKPNLTARLKVNDYTNEKALLIPQSIISENATGDQYIYIVKDKTGEKGVAERVIIKTGKTQGDDVEILEGITNKVEIVLEGARSVKDGQAVNITTTTKK